MGQEETGVTAEDVKGLLADRFSPPEYLFMTEFMFDAHEDDMGKSNRYIDAFTFCNVPTWGHTMQAFEIKVSRSDWLTELKNPFKSEAAASQVDFFWVVAPYGVVKVEELPPKWGLMVVQKNGKGLRITKQAEALREPLTSFPMGRVAFMLRKGLREMRDHAFRNAYDAGYKAAKKVGESHREAADFYRKSIGAVNDALGVDLIRTWANSQNPPVDPVMAARIRAALMLSDKDILDHVGRLERALQGVYGELPRFVKKVNEAVAGLGVTARLHPAGVLMALDRIPIEQAWEALDDEGRERLLRLALPEEATDDEVVGRFARATFWGALTTGAQNYLRRLSPEQIRSIVTSQGAQQS